MPAMKASEDALLNEAKASAVANDAIIPRRPHRGGGREGVSYIKDRKTFFSILEQGLQQYFDTCDRYWGGILHLTVGVKTGKVGGIIKSESTLTYEGYTLHRIETILRYVLPRHVARTEVDYAVGAVLDELRGTKPDEQSTAEVVQVTTEPLPEEAPKKRKYTRRVKSHEQINN